MKAASLALIVAMTPAVVHAQCLKGDWQCWHNYHLGKAKDDLDRAQADLDRSNNDFMEQVNRDVVRKRQKEVQDLQRRRLPRHVPPPPVAECETRRSKSAIERLLAAFSPPDVEEERCESILAAPANQTLLALNRQVVQLRQAGKYAEAIPIAQRALALTERLRGPDHPDLSTRLNHLASLFVPQGRYAEAEPLWKRSLAIREKALGPEHPHLSTSLDNLAYYYVSKGRYGEAEPLLKRSLAIREKALSPGHPDVGTSLNNLAAVYEAQARYADAEPLWKRSLAMAEKVLGAEHPEVAQSLDNLAQPYREQGRYADAEPLLKRSLAIRKKALGPEHPAVSASLNNLAELYRKQARYAEAEPLLKRSLAVRETVLGPEHPDVGASLNDLAALHLMQGEWSRAADYLRRGSSLTVRRAKRETVDRALTGKAVSGQTFALSMLLKTAHRLAAWDDGDETELTREMFVTAQWAQVYEAAAALGPMAVREAKGDDALSSLVRQRHHLVGEWRAREMLLTLAASQLSDRRNAQAENEQRSRLDAIDARIKDIDRTLAKDFPGYVSLARPEPLSIADVQAHLNADEALVLFLHSPEWEAVPEETFVWVITKSGWRWARSDLGTKALTDKVGALRRALDPRGGASASSRRGDDGAGDFDLGLAHDLYEALFGPAADLIGDKRHLIVVPSGPLTGLPFHVLVTQKPAASTADAYRTAQWLVRRHAVSTLPSVADLAALRRRGSAAAAAKPFIGFADPAFNKPVLTTASLPQKAAAARGPSFRGAAADAGALATLRPLPETADEVRAIAGTFGGSGELHIGRAAAEWAVKRLPLDQYRIVHFATHGLVAGEIADLAEPALALSAPDQPSDDDDGMLTASEVAMLKLNAQWVVLSACKAAGGDKPGAEILSGLARAFFYAGARTLLVSHWPVPSDAAVKLTTTTFAELEHAPTIGPAEALRRSMLAMIDAPGGAHPSSWAPFVIVGEGAAGTW
jgi:CHAT domain-containing protein/tetratricopeptide (TPR) repeat protein